MFITRIIFSILFICVDIIAYVLTYLMLPLNVLAHTLEARIDDIQNHAFIRLCLSFFHLVLWSIPLAFGICLFEYWRLRRDMVSESLRHYYHHMAELIKP